MEVGPPWGAVLFIHAHGRKLRKRIRGKGVLLNQGDDIFGNYTSRNKAAEIQASILGMNHSVEFYRDILRDAKLDAIDKFSRGERKTSTKTSEAKWAYEVFMASGGNVDVISLDGCNEYEFDREDDNPREQEAHRITFVYADPSIARRVKIGYNLFDEHPQIKLSDLIRHYTRIGTPLPLCIVSLACPYDSVISRKPDLSVPKTKRVRASEAIGAYMVSSYQSKRSRSRSQDQDEYPSLKEFLKGIDFDGKSKRKKRTRKK